jgi:hypothetical protein
MKFHIDKKSWAHLFKGWLITDCAIRSEEFLALCLRKKVSANDASEIWDSDIPTRLIFIKLKVVTTDNWGDTTFNQGFSLPVLGVSRAPFSHPQGMLASKNWDGDVWARGSGLDGPLEQIDKGGEPFPKRLKCINGITYAASAFRRIYKRVAVGQWEPMNEGFPKAARDLSQGFSDMDAFSESDMYAVGGNGDVWHYDGKRWTQMGFPSNVELGTVTCAGDGNVYISGEGGSLWVGQKSTWKSIYKGGSSILWNDVLWFEGKLWLSSDYQFRIWNGKTLEAVMHEGKVVPMNGHMDAYDGLLAIASSEYVMTYDGKTWKTIVAPYLD